jgi:hypothetical protein
MFLKPGAMENRGLLPHLWHGFSESIPELLMNRKINLFDLVGKEAFVSLVALIQGRLPEVKRGVRPGSWEYADVGGASAASTPSGGAGAAAPARSAGDQLPLRMEHGIPTAPPPANLAAGAGLSRVTMEHGVPTAPAPANLAATARPPPGTGTGWARHMGLGGGKKRRRKTKRRRTRRTRR